MAPTISIRTGHRGVSAFTRACTHKSEKSQPRDRVSMSQTDSTEHTLEAYASTVQSPKMRLVSLLTPCTPTYTSFDVDTPSAFESPPAPEDLDGASHVHAHAHFPLAKLHADIGALVLDYLWIKEAALVARSSTQLRRWATATFARKHVVSWYGALQVRGIARCLILCPRVERVVKATDPHTIGGAIHVGMLRAGVVGKPHDMRLSPEVFEHTTKPHTDLKRLRLTWDARHTLHYAPLIALKCPHLEHLSLHSPTGRASTPRLDFNVLCDSLPNLKSLAIGHFFLKFPKPSFALPNLEKFSLAYMHDKEARGMALYLLEFLPRTLKHLELRMTFALNDVVRKVCAEFTDLEECDLGVDVTLEVEPTLLKALPYLQSSNIGGEHLRKTFTTNEHVPELPSLTNLSLCACAEHNKFAPEKCPNTTKLAVTSWGGCSSTDLPRLTFQFEHLTSLHMRYLELSTDTLRHFSSLPNLEHLGLKDTSFKGGAAGVRALMTALEHTKLTALEVWNGVPMNIVYLDAIVSSSVPLKWLEVAFFKGRANGVVGAMKLSWQQIRFNMLAKKFAILMEHKRVSYALIGPTMNALVNGKLYCV